jgi:hypothetical protein
MVKKDENASLVWFSRILRWGLGSLFTGVGIIYYDKGTWPAILFGGLIFATGFFRPKRCIDENGCDLNHHDQRN